MPYSDPERQRTYSREYRRRKYKKVEVRKRTGIAPRDLTGFRFGRLIVQWPAGIAKGALCWLCLCDCGTLKIARGINLRCGHTKSCGCWYRENTDNTNRKIGRFIHNRTDTLEFRLWMAARTRSRKYGLPFNIILDDIVIPSHCPLLGIKLEPQKGRLSAASPSLDRIKPELGYIRGNIWVVSWRANTLKSDASLQELTALVENWKLLS